ncbi:MAG: ferritin family protein [Candidatus Orphnella occulta]|nr:ferritin family protein [Candidatus Orphnella occulta]
MEKTFSATDIVEIAIEIEKNGRTFYTDFSKKLKEEKAKDFFLYMSEEEAEHEKKFKEILSSVMKHEPCESYPQDYFAYFNAIAQDCIFNDAQELKERFSRVESVRGAIDFSIGIEKDSILIYESMKKMVPDKDKPLIAEIISQEKEHVLKLWNLRKEILNKKGE